MLPNPTHPYQLSPVHRPGPVCPEENYFCKFTPRSHSIPPFVLQKKLEQKHSLSHQQPPTPETKLADLPLFCPLLLLHLLFLSTLFFLRQRLVRSLRYRSTMGNVRREFEVIDDGDDFGDVLKYGKPADQRDMARMGKIQEMRVRLYTIII